MRKALQAEQSKAEKLLQLASLEKRIMEKDIEIKELERRIWDMLEAEKEENAAKEAAHTDEQKDLFKQSQDLVKKIAEVLQNTDRN